MVLGDSEMAEGSIWEAFEEASFAGLDNLTAIIDVNRLGQSGPTRHAWDLDAYRNRAAAFGWHTIELDGHKIPVLQAAFKEASATKGKPTAIIAHTIKGKGVSFMENNPKFHGTAPTPDEVQRALQELQ